MTSNKYTRDFEDYNSYPWPGKNMPAFYDHKEDAGDGNPGLQRMIQGYVSAYGPYHVIEGCAPTIDGTDATGAAGWVMYSGSIVQVAADSGKDLSTNLFLMINSDGTWGTTGAKPTGVLIAANVNGSVYDIRSNRWDANSKSYFPNDTYHYGAANTYADILGHGDIISGYESVSADSGIFQHIEGFSDIEMGDSLDFGGSYHLKGVSQITGAIISGSQITGAILISDGIINASQITGTAITGGTIYTERVYATNEGGVGAACNLTLASKNESTTPTIFLKDLGAFSTDLNVQLTGDLYVSQNISGSAVDAPQITGTSGSIGRLESDYIDSLLGIGADNLMEITLPYEGGEAGNYFSNVPALQPDSNGYINYGIPLPLTIGDKSLYISGCIIGLEDADASNYIYYRSIIGFTDHDSKSVIASNNTSLETVNEHDWQITPTDVSSYKSIKYFAQVVVGTQGNLGITYVKLKYYYA